MLMFRRNESILNKERLAAVVALCVVYSSTAIAKDCPATLAYLADRLPQYNNPSLEQMRNSVLEQNIVQAMERARAQGATPAQAAAAALDLAEKVKSQVPVAEQCVRQLSTDPERTMTELRNGTFKFYNSSDNAMEACAAQYVLQYYMLVAAKETAIVAACLARKSP
jgi:hypothetical protein